MTVVEPRLVEPGTGRSEIVHLVCCVDPRPQRSLCGWDVSNEAVAEDDPGPECVVCCHIAGELDGVCPNGGRCPE